MLKRTGFTRHAGCMARFILVKALYQISADTPKITIDIINSSTSSMRGIDNCWAASEWSLA